MSSIAPPPFEILGACPPGPVVIEIPHAGLDLTPLDALGLSLPSNALEAGAPWADSDVGAAALCEGVEALGARRIVARVSRHVLDLNTEPRYPTAYQDKLPPGLGDTRCVSLAGVVWWERRRTREEIEILVRAIFDPYHAAIAREIAASREAHGRAALLSVHTYPDHGRKDAPDLVLGTRNGQCSSLATRDALADTARREGLSVAVEAPFQGGCSVARHAGNDVEALQIEIARSLVCSEGDRRRPALDEGRVARTARVLRALVETLTAR